MPFHIDRFRGSPDVQAMHPIAKLGYLMLLASQWQTSDCLISSDPIDLAAASSLGDKLWAQHGPRILRKFETIDGKLRNSVLYIEWMEAKRVFEARQASAHRTNIVRSPSRSPSRPADTQTGTGTVTTTEKKQILLRAKKRREVQAKPPCKTDIYKARHKEFKAAIGLYWQSKNPGVDMPWAGPEGKALEMWLRASPNCTIEQFTGYLRNRFKSDANHTERPSVWIHHITSYASEPLNKFKQPQSLNGGNGNGAHRADQYESRADRNVREAIELLDREEAEAGSGGDRGTRSIR
jgi:hypothetical protein